MCFCVSNLFTLIHTDWCSILFSSHRGLTSSCRSWRSQDWYQYERICISVWKILEGFGLYEEFIYFPHFHETYSKTSLLIDFHICNSDSDHQVASFSIFYRLFSPNWKSTLYKQRFFFFLKANYEPRSTEWSQLSLKNS